MKKKLKDTLAFFENELEGQLPIVFFCGLKKMNFDGEEKTDFSESMDKLQTNSYKIGDYYKPISKCIDAIKK